MRKAVTLLLLALFFGAHVPGTAMAKSAERVQKEIQLKAAILYQFLKFVEWPPGTFDDPQDPLVLGFVGKELGAQVFRLFEGKRVHQRPIRFRWIESPDEAPFCHVLYLCSSQEGRFKEILEGLDDASVLTVSDLQGVVDQGGMVGLVKVNDTVRFEINLSAARDKGLLLNSRLFGIASRIVRDDQGGER